MIYIKNQFLAFSDNKYFTGQDGLRSELPNNLNNSSILH
jgi:hypothetical protein